MGNGFVNQYGHPLGGCLFGTMVAGRSAHSMRCACANCSMWRSQKAGQHRAAQKRRMERAAKRKRWRS